MTLFAQRARAADFGMEWLPLREPYTWPAPLPDAVEFNPKAVDVKSLPGPVQTQLKAAAAGEALPAEVEVWRGDLNADGKAEWFVSVPPLAGLGGAVYLILQETEQGAVRLALLPGHLQMLVREVKTGWVQIACLTKDGGGRFVRSLWGYDADTSTYQRVRQEEHDFLTRRVTVEGHDE